MLEDGRKHQEKLGDKSVMDWSEEVIRMAIRCCKNIKETSVTNHITASMDIAIESLEKQIPKKPTFTLCHFKSGLSGNVAHCPSCSEYLSFLSDTSYCPYCGQLINWSEE